MIRYLYVAFAFLALTGCLLSCEKPLPSERYHKSRGELIPVMPFTGKEICENISNKEFEEGIFTDSLCQGIACKKIKGEEIKNRCEKGTLPYIKKLLSEAEKRFPPEYFDPNPNRSLPHEFSNVNLGSSDSRIKSLQPRVEIATLPLKNEITAPFSFKEISPEGQQALVNHLGKRSSTKADDLEFLEQLLWVLRHEKNKEPSIINQSVSRIRTVRLLINASKNSSHPSDRVEKINTFITFLKGAERFYDIKLPETLKPTLNLGKLTEESKSITGLELGGSVPIPNAPVSATAHTTSEFKRALEKSITKEFARTSIHMNSSQNTIYINQEAPFEGIDLSGNVITDISFELPHQSNNYLEISDYYGISNDDPNPLENIKSKPKIILNQGNVDAIVGWTVQARVVTKGEDTISEGDDEVVPVLYKGVERVNLWRNNETIYYLVIPYFEKTECKVAVLVHMRHPEGVASLMSFRDPKDAYALRTELMKMFKIELNKVLKKHPTYSNQDLLEALPPSFKLKKGFFVGFYLKDPQKHRVSKDDLRLIWEEDTDDTKSNKLIILPKKLSVFQTTSKDFPLDEGAVWENQVSICPQS